MPTLNNIDQSRHSRPILPKVKLWQFYKMTDLRDKNNPIPGDLGGALDGVPVHRRLHTYTYIHILITNNNQLDFKQTLVYSSSIQLDFPHNVT